MIATQNFINYPEFSDNGTNIKPDDAKYSAGYIPSEVLPAEHLNYFLNGATKGVSDLNAGLLSVEKELNSLLSAGGETPDSSNNSQVLNAVNYLIQATKTNLQATIKALVPAGVVAEYGGVNAPSGWLLCQGQAVSRTDYADLFAAIGTKYGEGDGSTTFNLPDARDAFPQGANGNLGTAIEAGLPNITGTVGNGSYRLFITQMALTGAFVRKKSSTMSNWGNGDNSETKITQMNFSASSGETKLDGTLRNDVYGKSDTVQPKAFCVNYIIKT